MQLSGYVFNGGNIMLDFIKSRRSTRKFKDAMVPFVFRETAKWMALMIAL